jgi:lysophospholipase L1-like esterase
MRIFQKRLVLILLAGVLMVGAVGAYLYFRFARPVGNGPAGPMVAREWFAQPWTKRQVLLVGLGDSVTAGFGARKGYSYFDRLLKNPADDFSEMSGLCLSRVLSNLRATNLSVSGSTSFEVSARQLMALGTNSPDVFGLVVITTGGNDLIHNYGRTPPREEAMYGATPEEAAPWIENFGRRLETTINGVQNRFPGGCQIFLANIYDPTDGVGDADMAGLPPWKDASKILTAYNEVIQGCAGKFPAVHVVDMRAAFLGHGIHCTHFWRKHYDYRDPHYWFYSNLEDPNERGYDVIRRLFLIEIAKAQGQIK